MSEVPVAVKRLDPATSSARPATPTTALRPFRTPPVPRRSLAAPKSGSSKLCSTYRTRRHYRAPLGCPPAPSSRRVPPPTSAAGALSGQRRCCSIRGRFLLASWPACQDSSQGRACFDSFAQRIAPRLTSITRMRHSDWPKPLAARPEAFWKL